MLEDRAYQREAIAAAEPGLAAAGTRGQIRHACGTGKTITAIKIAEKIVRASGLVVWTCPTLDLLDQTLRSWLKHAGRRLACLAVASDEGVADSAVQLADLPCPVTTDPEVIAEWVRANPAPLRLILSTVISSDRVGAALLAAGQVTDLLVVDEAHETAGVAGKHTALVHDDTRLPAERRLYLSATPRILTGRRDRSEDLISMDGPEFGEVLHSYPFSAAVRDKYLDDYQLAVIAVSRQEVLTALRRADPREAAEAFAPTLHAAAVQVALTRAAKQWDLRRIIAFCPRIDAAQAFVRTLPTTVAALDPAVRPDRRLTAAAVWGRQSVEQRRLVMDWLRHPPEDGWTVLANAKVLGRGLDVPAVDGVVFTHRKESTVDIVQAVGRAARPHPEGRRTAIVLVPILLPDDPHELTDVGDPGQFETLWQVARALRAHDDVLAAELDKRRVVSAGGGDVSLPQKIVVQLPDGFDETWLDHLTIRLVRSTTSTWWEGYAAAQEFHGQHGHLRVARRFVDAQGRRLGQWIVDQRQAYARRLLAPERVAALEELSMAWSPQRDHRQKMLNAAAAFYAEHGHLAVPTEGEHRQLGRWIGLRGELGAEQQAALDRIDPLWREPRLSRGLAAARAFHTEHGHLNVPTHSGVTEAGIRLDRWLRAQRAAARSDDDQQDHGNPDDPGDRDDETSLIDAAQDDSYTAGVHPVVAAQLDAMGFDWDPAGDDGDAILAAIQAFQRKHGHLEVDDPEQRRWLHRQRGRHHRGKLGAARHAAITAALGPDWVESHDEHAEQMAEILAELQAFQREHGHLEVEDPEHRRWLVAQRKNHRRGKLGAARSEAITAALGPDWVESHDERTQRAEEILAELQAFQREHGHLEVEDPEHREWLTKQRGRHRRGELGTARGAVLAAALGPDWATGRAEQVEEILAELQVFQREHGHLEVEDPEHRKWLAAQRKNHRHGKLGAARSAAITAALGPDWVEARDERAEQVAEILAELQAFQLEHGHLEVQDPEHRKWLTAQRKNHRRGKLGAARSAAIEAALGPDWADSPG